MSKLEKIMKGLEVIKKYYPALNENVEPICPAHDVLMISPVVETSGPVEMLAELEEIGGWRVDEGEDCWTIFT